MRKNKTKTNEAVNLPQKVQIVSFAQPVRRSEVTNRVKVVDKQDKSLNGTLLDKNNNKSEEICLGKGKEEYHSQNLPKTEGT